jgi:hypothetical protein
MTKEFVSEGEYFVKQGRDDFLLKGCVILYIITYKMGNSGEEMCDKGCKKSGRKLLSSKLHAEKMVINDIKKKEKKQNW